MTEVRLTLIFNHLAISQQLPRLLIPPLREMCPNTEFLLVRIFRHSDWIRRDQKYLSVFSPNAGKYIPEKAPYLDTFHVVHLCRSRITNGYFNQQPSTGQSPLNVQLHYNITQQQVSNDFFLKWVNGTTVSKCYECNGRIPNHPTTPLENLINTRKDVWHYRHRTTGQLQYSSQPQNLHFHLSLRCVVAKYPMFLRSDLKIDQDMWTYLTSEHKMKLFSEFNVIVW